MDQKTRTCLFHPPNLQFMSVRVPLHHRSRVCKAGPTAASNLWINPVCNSGYGRLPRCATPAYAEISISFTARRRRDTVPDDAAWAFVRGGTEAARFERGTPGGIDGGEPSVLSAIPNSPGSSARSDRSLWRCDASKYRDG